MFARLAIAPCRAFALACALILFSAHGEAAPAGAAEAAKARGKKAAKPKDAAPKPEGEAAARPRLILVRAAELHVGDGRVYKPGQMLLESGRIKELGSQLEAPEGAELWEEASGVISPWLVDPSVHVALGSGEAGKLESALLTTADARPLWDPFLPILREEGIFAVALVPEATDEILGRSVVIGSLGPGAAGAPILTPDAHLVIDATSASSSTAAASARLALAETLDATERYSKKRAEWAAKSGSSAKQHAERHGSAMSRDAVGARSAGKGKQGEKSSGEPKLEPAREILAKVNEKKLPLRLRVDRAADVTALLALAQKRGLSLTLVGCRECGSIAELIAESQASVILEPPRDSVGDMRGLRQDPDLAAKLAKAGARLAVSAGGAWPSGPAWLRVAAADLAALGVPRETAIAAMSGDAARAAGLADPYLLAGQPARFLVWDRDPLEPLAQPIRRVIPADVGFDTTRESTKAKPSETNPAKSKRSKSKRSEAKP